MAWSVPLLEGIVNNALFHFSTYISHMLPQIFQILHFYLVNSLRFRPKSNLMQEIQRRMTAALAIFLGSCLPVVVLLILRRHLNTHVLFVVGVLSSHASGCVAECRICNREVAGLNPVRGYFRPRSTQPSIPWVGK